MSKRHRRELRKANERHLALITKITDDRDAGLVAVEDSYHRRAADLLRHRDEILREANEKFPKLLQDLGRRFEEDQQAAQTRHDRLLEESRQRHESEWNAMAAQWREGMTRLYDTFSRMDQESRNFFPGWVDPAWQQWRPPTVPPPAIRFGEFTVRLDQVPGGLSADPQLAPLGPEVLGLPALVPFPQQGSLLIQAAGEGRQAAVQLLQSVMLRLLATIPPGKVRFTIIDPVGLGENFAAFMHLADFDEGWSPAASGPSRGISKQRLADLSEHMENVIQKYLRNEFQTIDEYNRDAGEVAEPFRFLVVANFPANFSETAARRLSSIAASGARCGVFTLMTVDTKQPLPLRFDLRRPRAARHESLRGTARLRLARPGVRPISAGARAAAARGAVHADRAAAGENAKDRGGSKCRSKSLPRREDNWTEHGPAASTCRWAGPGRRGCNI